ncbi:MAG: hypothetical protein LVR00_01330 [Rhabdochlamydiaceae bacterium]|jgi:hypothetical protein
MASIDKISGLSILTSAPALTQQPLSVRFADHFHHLKAHAPALTNRAIWIVAGAIALALLILHRLTRSTGVAEKPSPKAKPHIEDPIPPPPKTQDNTHYEPSIKDGKIVDHARLFDESLRIIKGKKTECELFLKPTATQDVFVITCSGINIFLQNEVLHTFSALVDDAEVCAKFSDKSPSVHKYIGEINDLIKQLETQKDENIDESTLKKLIAHLATAVKTLQTLCSHFPIKTA